MAKRIWIISQRSYDENDEVAFSREDLARDYAAQSGGYIRSVLVHDALPDRRVFYEVEISLSAPAGGTVEGAVTARKVWWWEDFEPQAIASEDTGDGYWIGTGYDIDALKSRAEHKARQRGYKWFWRKTDWDDDRY